MSVTSEALFSYLREVFYASSEIELDLDKIEEDYQTFAKGLMFFAHCFSESNDFANALARGDLSVKLPSQENELASPLKSLHASLKHLTWQTQRVAMGDYKQRVDFMGEFAEGFNMMVAQLADRQQKLEDEIQKGKKHARALEQSNLLLSNLTRYIPQQIVVVEVENNKVLLFNDMAKQEMEKDEDYIDELIELLPDHKGLSGSYYVEILMNRKNAERYLAVNAYLIEWNKMSAVALVISDISAKKRQIRELEIRAYHDSLTRVFNRFYGMLTLNEWMDQKRRFALVFVDMDKLKYVNDAHGHSAGDEYIISVSRHLQAYSDDAVVSRLGGDEFMLLAPEASLEDAQRRMAEISHAIENDVFLNNKSYKYSISLGIVAVDSDNDLPSSTILSVADEKMYEHKRAKKKARQKVLLQEKKES